jgi:hypothetical protein
VLNKATGLPLFAQILIIPIILIALSIVRHIAQQTLFVNKDEPPLVFSWVPLIGSTVDYGMNPYKFYMKYQKKVNGGILPHFQDPLELKPHSMATCSRLFSWERDIRSASDRRAIILCSTAV